MSGNDGMRVVGLEATVPTHRILRKRNALPDERKPRRGWAEVGSAPPRTFRNRTTGNFMSGSTTLGHVGQHLLDLDYLLCVVFHLDDVGIVRESDAIEGSDLRPVESGGGMIAA